MLFLSRFVVNCKSQPNPPRVAQMTYVFGDVDLQLARYGQQAGHGGVKDLEGHERLVLRCAVSLRG